LLGNAHLQSTYFSPIFMQLFSISLSGRAAALACLLLLGACSKKKDDAAPATTTSGVTWTADNTNYTSTVATTNVIGTDLYVTGVSGVTNGIANNSISLVVPAATGTYSIAAATGNANYVMSYNITTSSTNSTAYVASNLRGNGAGTVTVTTFSATEVVGTFSFTGDNASGGTDKKVVTNGKFNIKR
jgi:hypothetical protein